MQFTKDDAHARVESALKRVAKEQGGTNRTDDCSKARKDVPKRLAAKDIAERNREEDATAWL